MKNLNRILVVDDSHTIRIRVRDALVKEGFEVTTAEDGDQALKTLMSEPEFWLVVTDLNMDEMDGLTLTREIRKMPRYEKTPIIMLTTEGDDDMRAAGKGLGITAWLQKPLAEAQFLKGVHKLYARLESVA